MVKRRLKERMGWVSGTRKRDGLGVPGGEAYAVPTVDERRHSSMGRGAFLKSVVLDEAAS